MLYLANLNTCRLYKTLCSSVLPLAYILFLLFDIYLFIYLAVSGLSCSIQNLHCIMWDLFFSFFFFTYFNWRLITLQYCSGFCHTLTWINHGCTCVPHPEPRSRRPPHPIPQGHPSALAPSTLSHASNLDWRSTSHLVIYIFQHILSNHPTLTFSHRVPKSALYLGVSFAVSHIGLLLLSF